jgi:tRNA threonylcarbamoyladenosine biosynthesis protein TsaE
MVKYQNLDLARVKKIAGQLAEALRNRQALVGLIGPLGSGKTTFIKAFVKTFQAGSVSSPSFVIAHEYRIKQGKLYHLDFYRLTKSKDLAALGLAEMVTGKNLILIEWIDRFPKLAKQCDILINLIPKPRNKRDVIIKTN